VRRLVQVAAAVAADPWMALQYRGAAVAHVGGPVRAGDAPGLRPTQRPLRPDRRRPQQDAGPACKPSSAACCSHLHACITCLEQAVVPLSCCLCSVGLGMWLMV
jgi:hypothetical protein